jgi:hypothetical protein
VKGIKHFAAGSQETECFTATVYERGKRVGYTENDGHGGCNNTHVDIALTTEEAELLDLVVDESVSAYVRAREEKKIERWVQRTVAGYLAKGYHAVVVHQGDRVRVVPTRAGSLAEFQADPRTAKWRGCKQEYL